MFEENEISTNANGGTEIAKRTLTKLLDPKLLDNFQIISSRPRDFDQSKIRVMYFHDLPEDPESAKFKEQSFQDNFHKFVFISNWQYQRYCIFHNIHVDNKSIVIESGITPAHRDVIKNKPNDGKIHIVYTSTPQRGLNILVPVFKKLAETHPEIHLDVFSSFKIYGWDDADKPYQPLYDEIINHPQMTYHGYVEHSKLLEHLDKSSIFAYPSIWMETSCRAMLEAMSAGLLCVHSNVAALPESSGSLNLMYHADLTNVHNHANMFLFYLETAINMVNKKQVDNMLRFNKTYIDSRYNIDRIKLQWESMLDNLLKEHPENSRGKQDVFYYSTVHK
jgi:glycosyltransferase involved in cell wall biosynthesis